MHILFWIVALAFLALTGCIGILVAVGSLPTLFGVIALPLSLLGMAAAAWLADLSERV